jgi:hypothetical protein
MPLYVVHYITMRTGCDGTRMEPFIYYQTR